MKFARNKAYTEGSEKGREKGRAEGRAEAILETARNLKALGASTDMIPFFSFLLKKGLERTCRIDNLVIILQNNSNNELLIRIMGR